MERRRLSLPRLPDELWHLIASYVLRGFWPWEYETEFDFWLGRDDCYDIDDSDEGSVGDSDGEEGTRAEA